MESGSALRIVLCENVIRLSFLLSWPRPATHQAAVEREAQKHGWRIHRTELDEGQVVEAKRWGARHHVRIGFDAGDNLALDNAKGEDVAGLVIPLTLQTLRTDPVRGANCLQA